MTAAIAGCCSGPPFAMASRWSSASRCVTGSSATASGPAEELHADTFHPTMKAWLYLDDVTEANGPFAYVPGSNRLTWRRLAGNTPERAGRDLPDRYSRRGSLRLTETDRQALGLPEPRHFAVPANTLVIANTFGFHARCPADKDSTRLAIYADSRTNPFNPWPGLDLHWSNQLKYRALQWYRRRQDRQAERRGVPSSWHGWIPMPRNPSTRRREARSRDGRGPHLFTRHPPLAWSGPACSTSSGCVGCRGLPSQRSRRIPRAGLGAQAQLPSCAGLCQAAWLELRQPGRRFSAIGRAGARRTAAFSRGGRPRDLLRRSFPSRLEVQVATAHSDEQVQRARA